LNCDWFADFPVPKNKVAKEKAAQTHRLIEQTRGAERDSSAA
jgi:hypothetical protein